MCGGGYENDADSMPKLYILERINGVFVVGLSVSGLFSALIPFCLRHSCYRFLLWITMIYRTYRMITGIVDNYEFVWISGLYYMVINVVMNLFC